MFRSKQKHNLSIVGGDNSKALSPEQDLGVMAQRIADNAPMEGDPLTAMPVLDALIELMASKGHSVDALVQERDRMKTRLNHHLTMFRSLAVQVETTHAVHACGGA